MVSGGGQMEQGPVPCLNQNHSARVTVPSVHPDFLPGPWLGASCFAHNSTRKYTLLSSVPGNPTWPVGTQETFLNK